MSASPAGKKGDLKASGKYDMPSIYCGAILFTIEVVVKLPLVGRESACATAQL